MGQVLTVSTQNDWQDVNNSEYSSVQDLGKLHVPFPLTWDTTNDPPTLFVTTDSTVFIKSRSVDVTATSDSSESELRLQLPQRGHRLQARLRRQEKKYGGGSIRLFLHPDSLIVKHSENTRANHPARNRCSRLLRTDVGVEKVTSISRMRISRSMLEESIHPCSG